MRKLEIYIGIVMSHNHIENKFYLYRQFRNDIKQRYNLEKGEFTKLYRHTKNKLLYQSILYELLYPSVAFAKEGP